MRFENKDYNPYQDPVPIQLLKEGELYYIVGLDGDFPIVTSIYYIGRKSTSDNTSDCGEFLYFQDSESYFAGFRFGESEATSTTFPKCYRYQLEKFNGVYDLRSTIEILSYSLHKQILKHAKKQP
jgi:hypothetical protein